MERIVIEVDDKIARAWQRAPETKRKEVGNKINQVIARDFIENPTDKYLSFLSETRTQMKEKGLTQEGLDNILNNE